MLRSLKQLEGFTVHALDGDIGTVHDFYFDDERWGVRYLVAETGEFWLEPSQVLISPLAFAPSDWESRLFQVALTRDRVKGSPGPAAHQPIARQFEREYFTYYGWPVYWGTEQLWGGWPTPGELFAQSPGALVQDLALSDPHLRSLREVVGYHLQGTDGALGQILDFIVDDRTWALRYLVIDTSNWWPGKYILIPPEWVERFSGSEGQVHVNLPKEAIQNGPVWNPEGPISRAFEVRLYDYYRRPAYWHEDGQDDEASRTREYLAGRLVKTPTAPD